MSDLRKIVIDGIEAECEPALTLIQACEQAGIEIPRFCYHERLSIAGNCRMCLIEVVGGPPKPGTITVKQKATRVPAVTAVSVSSERICWSKSKMMVVNSTPDTPNPSGLTWPRMTRASSPSGYTRPASVSK